MVESFRVACNAEYPLVSSYKWGAGLVVRSQETVLSSEEQHYFGVLLNECF